MNSQISSMIAKIEEKLKTVYDPEFPMVDIYTLWLIYDVKYVPEANQIDLVMTFTTPFCPMAEMLQEMIRNAVLEVVPGATVNISVTFDPPRNQHMIKDPDLQRMFQ